MSAATIDREELRSVMADALDIPQAKITDTANFVEDLGVDSLMSLEVMVQLEQKYGVKLTEEEFRTITTFQDAHTLLQNRLSQA
ncbi:acyl carrier protein [Streptomyces palmae]|uniref:Acyl carrier protein n=1 Tax=Streptomyces palmae TaxID=1701085 RepID=A0A4Z0HGD4_9ACTN|nr:acyl carrier protein [Streptomyces palmae]TGB19330.1 acyl carrier protein [Streptomyces palmae]